MGGVVDRIFGGESSRALRAQSDENANARRLIDQYGAQARGDALGLFPASQANRDLGNQAALDVFGQYLPQQMDAFQQGNVGAQQALLAGLPQFQNAILGLPVDYSAMQPRSVQYDTAWTQQQLPQFQGANPLGGQMPPQPGGPGQTRPGGYNSIWGPDGQFNWQSLLSGKAGG